MTLYKKEQKKKKQPWTNGLIPGQLAGMYVANLCRDIK